MPRKRCTDTAMLGDWPNQTRRLDPTRLASDWRPPEISSLPSWRGAKRIGLDTEFRDATLRELGIGVRRDPNEHYMCGVSFAIEDGPKHYLPFAHDGGDNLPRENVLAYLRDQFRDFDGDVVGANLPCELDWLWDAGVPMPKVRRFYDVQVADPLIYELHKSYKLNDISKRWGIGGKNEEALRAAARMYGIDPKVDMWRLAARHVGPYAEDDADQPLRILRKQEHVIEEHGLTEVWDMESRLLPILVRMTRRGVVVDMDRVDKVEQWSRREEQAAWDVVMRETGVAIPVGECMNVELLTRALRAAGLDDCIGENSRGDSVTKDKLHGCKHPVALAILDARKASIIRTTFVNGTRKHAVSRNGGEEWRIHCAFNQIRKTDEASEEGREESSGVAFGRLSASHPNMQNQPAADRRTGDNRVGCMWRSVYRAERDCWWTSCDIKQQEPRWSFHYGAMLEEMGIPGVVGALALCERLNANPLLDTYDPLVELTGQKRPVCKIMWLSRAYGKGDGALCEDLGQPTQEMVFVPRRHRSIPVDSEKGQELIRHPNAVRFTGAGPEGAAIIAKFDEQMPFLKTCAKKAKERAEERGYVTLLSGRRCHFEPDGSGGYEWCNKAFNRIIQGTSAEQMKRIMLAVDAAGFGPYLMLQVHDELASALESEGQAKEMSEVMRTAVPMRVPTVVDVERGPSWGESMSIEEVIDGKKVKKPYVWNL